jgi:outer membrane receptor for ferrienterochelin and colicins
MQAIRMPLRTISAGLLLAWAGCSVAGLSEDEAELAALYGDKSFISIATGAKQSTSRAPAVATVITAEDIAATGARNVDEALQAVPGLHVSVGYIYDPVYAIRGVHTKYNPQVLMLLNGVPLTNPYLGNRGDGWATIPAENIARIEVIRGPGSALYGADAFTGVINVITKTSADIDGTLAGARVGSYNNREGWIQHGGKIGPFQLAASLHVGKTDGPDETVAADTQSGLDKLFGTSASYAPGPVQRASDMIDGSIDLAYDKWRLRANYASVITRNSGRVWPMRSTSSAVLMAGVF